MKRNKDNILKADFDNSPIPIQAKQIKDFAK